MPTTIEGKVLKYGDNVNTDAIYPSRYMVYTKPEDMAKYAMAGLDPNFPSKIKEYGLIVAGKNFGCGSSREHAPLSLKYAGVKCVVAESFARIFFRNAINVGLPIIEHKNVYLQIDENDMLQIDMERGLIKNLTKNVTLNFKPFPSFLLKILEKGGLIEYLNAYYG
ncbi:MAG: 3-isopropylmalate dehydratase small subunit [Candidatus Bathyarchaeota archaeon]